MSASFHRLCLCCRPQSFKALISDDRTGLPIFSIRENEIPGDFAWTPTPSGPHGLHFVLTSGGGLPNVQRQL